MLKKTILKRADTLFESDERMKELYIVNELGDEKEKEEFIKRSREDAERDIRSIEEFLGYNIESLFQRKNNAQLETSVSEECKDDAGKG
jgi:hypothetical protein